MLQKKKKKRHFCVHTYPDLNLENITLLSISLALPLLLCCSCHHHISFCHLGVFSVLQRAPLYLRPSCLPVSSTVCLFDKMLVVSSRCVSLKNLLNVWTNIPFPQYKHIFTHLIAASSPFSIASG